ncbi:MAG: hypothetical protein ACE1Y2_08080, partial [Stenotrophomonas maltophilia]
RHVAGMDQVHAGVTQLLQTWPSPLVILQPISSQQGFQWTLEGQETLFIKSKVLLTPGPREWNFLSAAAEWISTTWRICGACLLS